MALQAPFMSGSADATDTFCFGWDCGRKQKVHDRDD